MSLFEWSTPARQTADRILLIIPNEIYFSILDHIAPPTGRLTPDQLRIFTNLSHVCRFFANFCLPRIFEFVDFSGSILRDDTPIALHNDAIYNTSRESMLCTQIAAKQPLALALAKTVRVCYFTNWKLDDTGSWAVRLRLFADKYIAGMSHMKNIRELKFWESFVDAKHWNAIATLESLEELSFDWCTFLQGPADVEAEKRAKFKVSCLRVVNCHSLLLHQVVAAIDARYLRTLAVDNKSIDHIDWLSQSALTELHFTIRKSFGVILAYGDSDLQRLHAILMQTSQSLSALTLFIDDPIQLDGIVRRFFDDPVWKNLPLLRSLRVILYVRFLHGDTITAVHAALEGIGLLTHIQSFSLESNRFMEISPTEVRRILDDKLGPASSLKYVDICETVLRLVDREWVEVPSSVP